MRFTLVPGLTDDPANVEGIAKFVAPMKNVSGSRFSRFTSSGEFKWKAMNLEYKHLDTPTPTPDLVNRVIEQFRGPAAAPARFSLIGCLNSADII